MGRFWTLPELNWRYQIRRRVGGNVCVLPWNVLLCAVVYFVVRKRSVGVPDDCMSVFPYVKFGLPVMFWLFLI